jgi:hypothetical protein
MPDFTHFGDAIDYAISELAIEGVDVDPGHWQGVSTVGRPDLTTSEILDLRLNVPLHRDYWLEGEDEWAAEMARETGCNYSWANEQFQERIGGIPRNPDPSHERWPWWHGQDDMTKHHGVFTHTYSERFWPRVEGHANGNEPHGIRYRFGDYDDLIYLLMREPYTRQAYLPIFFPEDTGAVHRGRIPCTLGYHFLLRGTSLHCWYEIRSCDAIRHFRDDLYLAARLVGHTITQCLDRELRGVEKQVWVDVQPGTLFFTAHSFHVNRGDIHRASNP